MKEKALLYVSVICSLSGLALLYFVSQTVELTQTKIVTITPDDIGKNVKVCGEIISKSVSKNQHIFLKLKDDTDKIDVVVFSDRVEKLNASELSENENICVIGSVDEYMDKLEIIPKKIVKVD